jgi:hypothetical protein
MVLLSDVVPNPLARAMAKELFLVDLFLTLFLSLTTQMEILDGTPLSYGACISVFGFSDHDREISRADDKVGFLDLLQRLNAEVRRLRTYSAANLSTSRGGYLSGIDRATRCSSRQLVVNIIGRSRGGIQDTRNCVCLS